MKCKFKVGDKVKVIKLIDISHPAKEKYIGETLTIREVDYRNTDFPYHMEEKTLFCWSEKELELVTEHATNEKIVITVDGRTTLARLYKDGKVVKSAEARCCPEDTFDFKVGANLAYERLMDVHVVEEVPVPVEPPKPKYYSGKVVCTGYHSVRTGEFTVGKIYTFTDGIVTTDKGTIRPRNVHPVENIDETMNLIGVRFIPLVEDEIDPNTPLTNEQLMKMDGEKVWLSSMYRNEERFNDCYCGWVEVNALKREVSGKDCHYSFDANGSAFGFKAYLTEQKAK